MDYSELIYKLLLQHLPGMSSALALISDTVNNVYTYVVDLAGIVEEYRLFVAMISFTSVLALILKRRYLV